MQQRGRVIAGLLLLAATGACERGAGELSQADRAAVQANIDSYSGTAVAANWDAWAQTITSDVFYSPPNLAPMNGREAVVTWVKTFPRIVSLTPTVEEMTGRGDMAFVRGAYTLVVELPDGSPMTEHGVFLVIHRRQPDGTWPYSSLMYHSTDPIPLAPAAATK